MKQIGKIEEAIEACQKAIAVDPRDKGTYTQLGIIYNGTGRLEDAISALKKALEIDPSYVPAHQVLAGVYQRQGRTDEAKEHVKIIEALTKQ